ncbi:EAL domain-containing protein [Ensifer adhaerens]|uniref:EAL domain-containing protein n=1 Tax=Ensifer adhaerens TaxID=106592 RepID=UPI00384D7873
MSVERLINYDNAASFLDHAIRRGQIGFSKQNVISLGSDNDIFYAECIGRIISTNNTVLTYEEFIMFFDMSGVSHEFYFNLLGLAIDWLQANYKEVLGCKLSLGNLSQNCTQLYELLYRKRSISPRLILEVTGGLPVVGSNSAIEFIKTVRALGYRVAVDDFGAEYSTVQSWLPAAVDIVKLDAFFIQERRYDIDKILRHMVGLATCIAPVVVVKGIETSPQLDLARRAGATHVQGSLLSEPTLEPVFHGRAACLREAAAYSKWIM